MSLFITGIYKYHNACIQYRPHPESMASLEAWKKRKTEEKHNPSTIHEPSASLILNLQRLHIPNTIRILINNPIRREKSHPGHTRNRLGDPLVLVDKRLVNHRLRGDVRVEVVRNKVVVAVFVDGSRQRGKGTRVTEHAAANCVEDFG